MITFLKVLLILLLFVVAAKLLPFAFALVAIVALAAGLLLMVGFGAVAGVAAIGLLLAVILSPVWLPILALVAVIALCRHCFGGKAA